MGVKDLEGKIGIVYDCVSVTTEKLRRVCLYTLLNVIILIEDDLNFQMLNFHRTLNEWCCPITREVTTRLTCLIQNDSCGVGELASQTENFTISKALYST